MTIIGSITEPRYFTSTFGAKSRTQAKAVLEWAQKQLCPVSHGVSALRRVLLRENFELCKSVHFRAFYCKKSFRAYPILLLMSYFVLVLHVPPIFRRSCSPTLRKWRPATGVGGQCCRQVVDIAGDIARELSSATRNSARRRVQLRDHLFWDHDAFRAVQLRPHDRPRSALYICQHFALFYCGVTVV